MKLWGLAVSLKILLYESSGEQQILFLPFTADAPISTHVCQVLFYLYLLILFLDAKT